MALHWVQGICFLLVAVVRVCQTVDASQKGEGARTQTTQHVVQVLIATQDLVTCARVDASRERLGGGIAHACVVMLYRCQGR